MPRGCLPLMTRFFPSRRVFFLGAPAGAGVPACKPWYDTDGPGEGPEALGWSIAMGGSWPLITTPSSPTGTGETTAGPGRTSPGGSEGGGANSAIYHGCQLRSSDLLTRLWET